MLEKIGRSGKILPTRGNIHDLSGTITYKCEIITLFLENYLTPEMAIKTNHSKEAVDRYIKDYHRVETLWKHGISDLEQISHFRDCQKPWHSSTWTCFLGSCLRIIMRDWLKMETQSTNLTCPVKRKQALLGSNLPGITGNKMSKGTISRPCPRSHFG